MGKLNGENKWSTSVDEILSIFHGSLLSVAPWLEKAKIIQGENESYDDWDNIVRALYENIVCSSLVGEIRSEYSIAKYDFLYENYSKLDYIEVVNKENSAKKNVFVSFQSPARNFSHVRIAIIDEAEKVIEYSKVEYDNLEFRYVKKSGNKMSIISKIEIVL